MLGAEAFLSTRPSVGSEAEPPTRFEEPSTKDKDDQEYLDGFHSWLPAIVMDKWTESQNPRYFKKVESAFWKIVRLKKTEFQHKLGNNFLMK